MTKPLGTSEFLGHRPQASRNSMLTKWTDRPPLPGTNPPMSGVNTVLTRRDYAYVLWRHQVPKVQVKADGSKELWTGQHVCWEEEDVLVAQFRRYDDERRRRPPQRCGICKLVEWTYQQIAEGKMSWVQPVFRFDDGAETRILRAGGITNLFGRDLSDGEKQQLKKHGIFPRDSWKESMWAKCNYLFCVVDYDDPGQGAQIAIVSQLLGSKVQKVIADRQASRGIDEGDPSQHPFVIQWLANNAKNVPFNEKYHARAIDSLKIEPGGAIDQLVSGDPPDVDYHTRRYNALEVRAALEDAAEVEFPWDEFFGKLDDRPKREELVPEVGDSTLRGIGPANGVGGKKDEPAASAALNKAPEPDCDCDECGKPIHSTDKKCPHCGAVFEAEEPPPQPQPRPRRTAVIAAPAVPNGKVAELARADAMEAGQRPTDATDLDGGLPPDGDDLPF